MEMPQYAVSAPARLSCTMDNVSPHAPAAFTSTALPVLPALITALHALLPLSVKLATMEWSSSMALVNRTALWVLPTIMANVFRAQ